ncbi:hypothetical protein NDK47_07695 [Brevibacillus ruminantium]|uniref:General stress protein n=1 Tax=Brevibacillus ruminantium TaxID=2950604 RepID=A0ABY4WJA1_9BACL|nr:hypothetical protein [Brevibacillus ruminantium]USG67162.1 hypothetical protein NDK47_07695 [Brevibacillus ruminantium]
MDKKIQGKLFRLCAGEFFAAVMFPVLWIMYLQIIEWTEPYLTSIPSIYAFVLLEFILLQGSLYWFLKWKQAKQGNFYRLPNRQLCIFVWCKRVNFLLIGIGFLFFFYQITTSAVDLYWFVFLFLFAIIEHVNYYHIRISYLSWEEIKEFIGQRGFRRSRLAREMQQRSSE